MKRTNKKGFTLVELVVVIAIIAILAAVLIPTFARLIKRANVSAQNQLIRNMNTALATDSASNQGAKHETMYDALKAAAAFGYDVAKINASKTDNTILWDSKNDVFCYLDAEDGKVKYIPENPASVKVEPDEQHLYWIIASAPHAIYSTYLYGYEGADLSSVKNGIDVGDETVSEITYQGSTYARNIAIRTNSASTNIILNPYVDSADPTKGDHIAVYGSAGEITGPKDSDGNYTGFVVAFNSIAINGKVVGLKAASGHIDLTNAVVEDDEEIIILATTTDVKVSNPNKVSTHAHATSEINANALNDPADSTKKSIGVTWDYDGNIAQNEIDDIHHHITDAQAEAAGESLGTGPVDGGGEWNYENTLKDVIYSVSNKEVAENASYVARIGGKGYETLAAAVADAVDGDTIVMLKDDLLTGTVNITKKISLDLNGKQVGRVVATLTAALLLSNGELTINDSVGTGSVLANAQAIGMTNSNDKLIINGGKIQGATYGVRVQKGNTVEIDGATIIGGTGGYGIFNQAAQTLSISNANISGNYAIKTSSANSNITITDSTLTGSQHALYTAATTNITIDNAMLYAPTCVYLAKGSHLELNGGSINATNSAILTTSKDNVITINSGTVSGTAYGITSYYNNTYYSGTITINGGSVSGQYGIRAYGDITVNSGSVIASSYYAIAQMSTTNPVNVNGGEIKSNGTGTFARGINSNVVNISGGDISGDYAVYCLTSTVSGGMITGDLCGIMCGESLTMTGGTVIVSGIETKKDSYSIFSTGATSISGTANIQNLNPYQEEPKLDDNGEVVLDENGKAKLNTYIPYGIFSNGTSDNKANLTINGGSISAPDGFALTLSHTDAIITNGTLSGANAIVSSTYDSTCTISDGMFNATGSQVCYAQNGIFTISGGIFTGSGSSNPDYASQPYRFTLNCLDDNRITKEPTEDYPNPNAWFYVTGGSFYQFNPSNDLSEGANTCFTPEGYHTEYNESTGYYTVVENN